jgi:hypothetical protein
VTRDEVRAVLLGGAGGIGSWGSAAVHERRAQPAPPGRACDCGCGGPATHTGTANGVALIGGCHLSVRRWVRDGR